MKTIRWSLAVLVSMSATLAAAGCDKDKNTTPADRERSDLVPASGERTTASGNRSAVDSITLARCDREQRCNNIGDGKKYDSREACVTSVRSDWQSELSALECPNGIEQNKLDVCIEHLRTDGCANPVETLGRVAACRQAELCRAG
jgi:hypothetical protein